MTGIIELKLQIASLQRLLAQMEAEETATQRAILCEKGWSLQTHLTFNNSDGIRDWEESWEVWSDSAIPKFLTWEESLELEEQGIVKLVRID